MGGTLVLIAPVPSHCLPFTFADIIYLFSLFFSRSVWFGWLFGYQLAEEKVGENRCFSELTPICTYELHLNFVMAEVNIS